MGTTMTWGMRCLYFLCTIKEFMMRAFSSIWIGRAVVFLLQHKSRQEKRESVAGDIIEDIQVEIRGLSWLLCAERRPQRS